jgi:glucose-1-phosphate cytidylyltransferase
MYAHWGFDDFVLCLGYRGNMIKEYFLNYDAMNNDITVRLGRSPAILYRQERDAQNFDVTLVDTGLNAMTGARVKRVEKYVTDGTFMVTYGDGLSDLNVQSLLEFHKSHGRLATVSAFQPTTRFGTLQLGVDRRVVSFAEKPQLDEWVSAGFFVFEPGVFNYLTSDDNCVLERDPLERLARDGQLYAFQHDSFFYAMDTYREYQYLNQLWAEGKAPWKVW